MANERDTLIVGYPGRLARAFASHWPLARRVGREDFDLTNRLAALRTLERFGPKLVINCAALTDMCQCEMDPELAWAVNVRGVRNLAEGCRNGGAMLVHFSSDYALDPINEYAWTKRASESLADLTIRAKIYDASHWAWKALLEGRPVRMLTTEFANPISTTGAVCITDQLLRHGLRGLIFVGTAKRLRSWQVGQEWAKVLGVESNLVHPIERLEGATARLREMFLDTTSLLAAAIPVPTLADDAGRHMELYKTFCKRELSAGEAR